MPSHLHNAVETVLASPNGAQKLESLRSRDTDTSIKGGGLLAFSGLIVASLIGFLNISDWRQILSDPLLKGGFLAAFVLCFIACALALMSMIRSGNFPPSKDADYYIKAYDDLLQERGSLIRASARFCMVGPFLFAGVVVYALTRLFFLV